MDLAGAKEHGRDEVHVPGERLCLETTHSCKTNKAGSSNFRSLQHGIPSEGASNHKEPLDAWSL